MNPDDPAADAGRLVVDVDGLEDGLVSWAVLGLVDPWPAFSGTGYQYLHFTTWARTGRTNPPNPIWSFW